MPLTKEDLNMRYENHSHGYSTMITLVKSFKFLGVHMIEDLSLFLNNCLAKKAHFLQRLKRTRLPLPFSPPSTQWLKSAIDTSYKNRFIHKATSIVATPHPNPTDPLHPSAMQGTVVSVPPPGDSATVSTLWQLDST